MNIKIGLAPLLCIVFTVLKLCNAINWSWWWVMSPVILPAALWILGTILVAIGDYLEKRGI